MITIKKIRAEIEKWRDIPGYEGLYQVSNLGRVKSLNYNNTGKEGIMSFIPDKWGYLMARLSKDNKRSTFKVHRLVAQAFIQNPENLPQVNHKDEDKTNNRVYVNPNGSIDPSKSNLEWCTSQYNVNYGTARKRQSEKIRKPIAQFSMDGEFIEKYSSAKEAFEKTGIYKDGIARTARGLYKYSGGFIWRYA